MQIANVLKSVGVQAVYGDAREIEGTTVVPVAVVGYGFGGAGDEEQGSGGGGGGYVWPVGAYVGDSLGVQFKPSDRTDVNVTALYSKFDADNINQNFMAWGSRAIGNGGTAGISDRRSVCRGSSVQRL